MIRPLRDRYFLIVRIIGALLIVAALAKVFASPPPWFNCLVDSPANVWIGLAFFEFWLGVALFLAPAQLSSWGFSVAFATCGAVTSGWLVLNDATSCGCFGRMSVTPRMTFIMDGLMAILLSAACPIGRLKLSRRDASVVGAVFFALGMAIVACGASRIVSPTLIKGVAVP